MKDKELRKLIGSRAKQRRLELNLTQPYVAEKMGVTASTILRYENGSIDNTKKMVLEGLSEALHVSIEWLRGETDEYETDITDKKELQIRDAMGDILKQLPLDLSKKEDAFLTKNGINERQGFLFAKPMPAVAFERWYKRYLKRA